MLPIPVSKKEAFSEKANLTCPICEEIMSVPTMVVTEQDCQHTFCKACIEDWTQRAKRCPGCNEPFEKLLVNRTAANTIEALGKEFDGKEEKNTQIQPQRVQKQKEDSWLSSIWNLLGIGPNGPQNDTEAKRVDEGVSNLLSLDEPKKEVPVSNVNPAPANYVHRSARMESQEQSAKLSFVEFKNELTNTLNKNEVSFILHSLEAPNEMIEGKSYEKADFVTRCVEWIWQSNKISSNNVSKLFQIVKEDFLYFSPELREIVKKYHEQNRLVAPVKDAKHALNSNPNPAKNVEQSVKELQNMEPPVKAPQNVSAVNQVAQDPKIASAYRFIHRLSDMLTMPQAKKIARFCMSPLEKRENPKMILKAIFEDVTKSDIQKFKSILSKCCVRFYSNEEQDAGFVDFLPEVWGQIMGAEMQLENRFGNILPKKENSAQPAGNANPAPARNVQAPVVAPQSLVQLSDKNRVDFFIEEASQMFSSYELRTMCELACIPEGTKEAWVGQGVRGTIAFFKYLLENENKADGNIQDFSGFAQLYVSKDKEGKWNQLWQERMVLKTDRKISDLQPVSPQDMYKFQAFLEKMAKVSGFNRHDLFFSSIPDGVIEDFAKEGISGTVKALNYVCDHVCDGKVETFGSFYAHYAKGESPGVLYPKFCEAWRKYMGAEPPAPKRPF